MPNRNHQNRSTNAKGVNIYPGTQELLRAACHHWLTCYQSAVRLHDAFHVALSGGTTPKAMYRMLSSAEFSGKIDWQRVHLYFGDERSVAADHPESNFRMARENLIDRIRIPESNVHPVPLEMGTPQKAAAQYERTLSSNLPTNEHGIPTFDLIMLGMGEDGHTASLFPDTTVLQETTHFVAAVFVPQLDTWRISLTLPVIGNARHILVLVTGETKSEILHHVLTDNSPRIYPIQLIQATGQMRWFVDQEAAQQLE